MTIMIIKTTKNILTLLNYRYMIKLSQGKKIEFYKTKYRKGRIKMGPRILKSKRVLFDLTQAEIAKELGITIKSYNAKENGKREFTLDEAKKISSLLKLNLNEVNDIFFNSAISR